jgi:hypothetical protein
VSVPFVPTPVLMLAPDRHLLYDFRRSESYSKIIQPIPERLLRIPSTSSSTSILDRPAAAGLMLGDAPPGPHSPLLNMSGSIPVPTAQPDSHEQPKDPTSTLPASSHPARIASQPTAPVSTLLAARRQLQSQRPSQLTHAYSTPPASTSQDAPAPAPGPPTSLPYHVPPAYASAPSSFGPRPGYVHAPYTTMAHSQPTMGMMHHSPPQFAYSPHPPPMSPAAYASMMRAPMFSPYPDPVNSQAIPYTSAASAPMHVFAPSPPPISPLPPATGSHQSYQSQYGYSTPQYGYAPPHPPSFSSPGVYPGYGQPPYSQQQAYRGSGEQDGQGTWWYMPNASGSFDQPSFQMPYFNQPQPQQPQHQPQHQPQPQPHHPSGRRDSQLQASVPPKTPVQSRRSTAQGAPAKPASSRDGGALSPTMPARSSPLPALVPIHAQMSAPASSTSERQDMDGVHGRKSYHPNPPAQRSEWVMWAGNVPSDASHDELWRFFNQPLPPPSDPVPSSPSAAVHGGVSSIFLITRSNCSFVNFESEEHLEAATARFNGQQLRANDPRCPRLVCRVRRRTDDLKAGVGGQRGMGMHTSWVREQRARAQEREGIPDGEAIEQSAGLSLSDGDGARAQGTVSEHTVSSGSLASTSSSFLAKHFPQRYFILKSLTQVRTTLLSLSPLAR